MKRQALVISSESHNSINTSLSFSEGPTLNTELSGNSFATFLSVNPVVESHRINEKREESYHHSIIIKILR